MKEIDLYKADAQRTRERISGRMYNVVKNIDKDLKQKVNQDVRSMIGTHIQHRILREIHDNIRYKVYLFLFDNRRLE